MPIFCCSLCTYAVFQRGRSIWINGMLHLFLPCNDACHLLYLLYFLCRWIFQWLLCLCCWFLNRYVKEVSIYVDNFFSPLLFRIWGVLFCSDSWPMTQVPSSKEQMLQSFNSISKKWDTEVEKWPGSHFPMF